SILYLVYRIRLNRLLAIERIRTHISRDLHDDVGSALSSINIWSEVAGNEMKKNPERSEEYLKRIHNSSQNMLDTMSDIIWAINPINDTVERLLARMKHYAGEMLEPKNIKFEFAVADEIKKVSIPMQYRRELYLIFKEAINNAAKYSEANKISVHITANRHRLTMDIKDNGKGFNIEDKSRGNGLRNMRARAKNMKAEIKFSSSPGEGTQIFLHQRFTRSGEVRK
ncbi:MAG: sensor histidine kinase, partial [Chitinophagales bacterium]